MRLPLAELDVCVAGFEAGSAEGCVGGVAAPLGAFENGSTSVLLGELAAGCDDGENGSTIAFIASWPLAGGGGLDGALAPSRTHWPEPRPPELSVWQVACMLTPSNDPTQLPNGSRPNMTRSPWAVQVASAATEGSSHHTCGLIALLLPVNSTLAADGVWFTGSGMENWQSHTPSGLGAGGSA
jgi:hypothetical protein